MLAKTKLLLFTLSTIVALGIITSCKTTTPNKNGEFFIENDFIKRVMTIKDGKLRTVKIINKLANTELIPTKCAEFSIRISQGTHTTETDRILTAKEFTYSSMKRYKKDGVQGIAVTLNCQNPNMQVIVHYLLKDSDFYMNKYLEITPAKDITIERIDIDKLTVKDANQPYKIKCIYARGKWSPGLGQPLYTTNSATFWGVEFPASYNYVKNSSLTCGYLWGRTIKSNETYKTYHAVVGVADNPKYNQDAFFDYINRIRVRPLRLQIQYNSWFDFHNSVTSDGFTSTVKKLNNELVIKRHCTPLKAYVIDDGWQDCGKNADWTTETWTVNNKFDKDFSRSFKATKDANSTLGVWMSPGCNFGARAMVPKYRKKGFEALQNYMSLAGPKYMGLLEKRMVKLTEMGVTYFKLDGLFGHLNTRDFELHGEKYGLPSMPQLGLEGINSADKELNKAKYDEMKTYYLVAGTERLMKIFTSMAKANPNVYIVISNGSYLSPWWLMYADSSWMIMAGDAAGGADRTGELTYRDGVYYEITTKEHTQFPICSIFNHEPKKVKSGESKNIFRKYLYMNMSRGTGFIELYLKTPQLQEHDWDVLAEGLQWAKEIFPTFTRSRMHGGNPRKNEVYGYTAWLKNQGYISFHNPSNKKQRYSIILNRDFGLIPNCGTFMVSSPIAECMKGVKNSYKYGETITIELEPKEIRVLNFDKTIRDWSALHKLQKRTPYTTPISLSIPKNHPILGTWSYKVGSDTYSRTFKNNGKCILKNGQSKIWEKAFIIKGQKEAIIENRYHHIIKNDGTLLIEKKYQAIKK